MLYLFQSRVCIFYKGIILFNSKAIVENRNLTLIDNCQEQKDLSFYHFCKPLSLPVIVLWIKVEVMRLLGTKKHISMSVPLACRFCGDNIGRLRSLQTHATGQP